ncbi:MAG: phosphoethanolamine transferase [Duncaniella sp.]|nr:phosphoethanolamine transferase [Duncaniella sp.]
MATMALFGLIVPAYRNRDVWFATLAGKIDMMCRLPEDLPLLDERLPLSVTDPETPPGHIVVIIGESHSTDCSQLYGYDLPTNPLLSAMQADSSLFVFTDATSRYYHTINCFRSFMTATHDDKPWNECENAFEVAASRGYQTFWLSNQSPVGFNDNAIATMASRADKVVYTTVPGEVDYSALPYDEALTSMLDSLIAPGSKQLFFVHLMGSHRSFENRYPADRGHFQPTDYTAYPAAQREDRACYDNSILYNDSVVSTLFRRLDSLDAVGLYFSDHGVDVFQSPSVTRITHANSDSLSMKAAARIPMLIYASPRYRTTHPLKMERLRRSLDTPVKNTQMVYTLMDMMGVRFRDDNRVDSLSAIRP